MSVSLTNSKFGKCVEDFFSAGHVGVTRHILSCQLISTMSNPTAGRSSSVSQHLRATEKILQGVIFNVEYVLSVEMRRVGGLTLKFAGSRGPWMQLRLNEPTIRHTDYN